jgi:hypothetical protein
MRTLRLSLVRTVVMALPGPIIHLVSPRPDTSTTILAMD